MMTFRKINLKAIPLANRQYHSWGNTFWRYLIRNIFQWPISKQRRSSMGNWWRKLTSFIKSLPKDLTHFPEGKQLSSSNAQKCY
jgi:hypothetical protein